MPQDTEKVIRLAHTDSEYESELRRLRELVIRMGNSVEEMIDDSIEALLKRDSALAKAVMLRDRHVNRLELESDDLCLQILARRQPVASDLRFITIAMKLVTDLERIGDLSVNACERVVELCEIGSYTTIPGLRKMADSAKAMVRSSFEAFIHGDAESAEQVIEMDDAVDLLFAEAFHKLLTTMGNDPAKVVWGTKIQSIAKTFERICDHAVNISELVVFMVRGKDIRHIGSREEAPEA